MGVGISSPKTSFANPDFEMYPLPDEAFLKASRSLFNSESLTIEKLRKIKNLSQRF